MKFKVILILFIVILVILTGSYFLQRSTPQKENQNSILSPTEMILKSPAFSNNQNIPAKYTCDGDDINPPLEVQEVPAETQSLALIVDDPDAPAGTWVHWLVWNIDPGTKEIAENSVPEASIQGVTSNDQPGWGGPCPPSGTHRYFFKIYALDAKLDLGSKSGKEALIKEMEKHILGQAELMGLYRRGN